jgi:hypothetical protein
MGLRTRRRLLRLGRILLLLPPVNLLWMAGFPFAAARRRRRWRRIDAEAADLGLRVVEAPDVPHGGFLAGTAEGREVVVDAREQVSIRALFPAMCDLDFRMRRGARAPEGELATGLPEFDGLFPHRRAGPREAAALEGRTDLYEGMLAFLSRRPTRVRLLALDPYGLRADLHGHMLYPSVAIGFLREALPELAELAGRFAEALDPVGDPVDPGWFLR